jgi:hypothetical protein
MCMTDTEGQEEWCNREQCATPGNDMMNSVQRNKIKPSD